MSTLDDLIKARSYVAAGWTQNVVARNAQGQMVLPTSLEAVSHCLDGAVEAAVNFKSKSDLPRFRMVMRALAAQLSVGPTPYMGCTTAWNDEPERTIVEVLDLFDRAIKVQKHIEEESMVNEVKL